MTKQQIEAFKKITPGKRRVELVQEWPFGIIVWAEDKAILRESAICHSTVQNTREDCETGKGFGSDPSFTRIQAARAIEEQDANAVSFAALPELLQEREEMLKLLRRCTAVLPLGDGMITEIEDLIAMAMGEETA